MPVNENQIKNIESLIYKVRVQTLQNCLKEKILELRSQGYNYNQIKSILGCSKGTISYHCGEGQKEKSRSRKRKRRSNPLVGKIEHFCEKRKNYDNKILLDRTTYERLQGRLMSFCRERKYKEDKRRYNVPMFTVKDLMEKIGDNPTCYLTGRSIDLNCPRSYHLDHIIPKSKGGNDSLDNCQITARGANMAKGDLSYDEFIQLCKEVLAHHESKVGAEGNAPSSSD